MADTKFLEHEMDRDETRQDAGSPEAMCGLNLRVDSVSGPVWAVTDPYALQFCRRQRHLPYTVCGENVIFCLPSQFPLSPPLESTWKLYTNPLTWAQKSKV